MIIIDSLEFSYYEIVQRYKIINQLNISDLINKVS